MDYRALRLFLDEAGLHPSTSDMRHIMRELDPARCTAGLCCLSYAALGNQYEREPIAVLITACMHAELARLHAKD